MLKFNPEHQLTLTPNGNQHLTTQLTITNPSPRPAPFKIKATRPTLFIVEPPTGLIRSHQSVCITIRTRQPMTPQLAHEVSYHNRFLVEYALVDRMPGSVQEGVGLISEDNRQEHKLYLASTGLQQGQERDNRSAISNHQSYRTVQDNDDFPTGKGFSQSNRYEGMDEGQKTEYLSRQMDRLQRQKSDLLISSRPRYKPSLMKLVIVFLCALIIGNLLGSWMGLGEETKKQVRKKKKDDQFEWFGLASYWRQPEQQEEEQQSWWKVWE